MTTKAFVKSSGNMEQLRPSEAQLEGLSKNQLIQLFYMMKDSNDALNNMLEYMSHELSGMQLSLDAIKAETSLLVQQCSEKCPTNDETSPVEELRGKCEQTLINFGKRLSAIRKYPKHECFKFCIPVDTPQEELNRKVIKMFDGAGIEMDTNDISSINRLDNSNVAIVKLIHRKEADSVSQGAQPLRELCNVLLKQRHIQSFYMVNGAVKIKVNNIKKYKNISSVVDLINVFGKETIHSLLRSEGTGSP